MPLMRWRQGAPQAIFERGMADFHFSPQNRRLRRTLKLTFWGVNRPY